MSILEEKIRKNKKDFDIHEPSAEHFEKFKARIEADDNIGLPPAISLRILWKAAAVILLIVAIAFLLPRSNQQLNNDVLAATVMDSTNYPEELRQVRMYYLSQKQNKMQQLESLDCAEESCAELKEIAKEDLEEIEQETQELENDLVEGQKDERVYKAIVNNYQLMGELLDKVLDQIVGKDENK